MTETDTGKLAAGFYRDLLHIEIDAKVELAIQIKNLENENKALKEENEILNNKLEYQNLEPENAIDDKVDD